MNLPFTTEQFLNIFRQYNESIFPMQLVFYLLGAIALYFLFSRRASSGRIISAILGFTWLWMGLVYHIMNFSRINSAAFLFGAFFIVEGLLILYFGVFRSNLVFAFQKDYKSVLGIIFFAYAIIIYSLIGFSAGHSYPYSPMFGVAPCPSTIFTFGFLVQQRGKQNFSVLLIPLVWSVLGFTAAFQLGVIEDIGLIVSGLTTFVVFLFSLKRSDYAIPNN
jgi:hypothetical protein